MRTRFITRVTGALLLATAVSEPASAAQILDAADGAELAAEIAADGVNRVALVGDRIARVVRAPGAFETEHDARTGDLYLMPFAGEAPGDGLAFEAPAPVTLFIGTEKGFTYRLALTPAARDSAQILIRNPAAAVTEAHDAEHRGDARVAELVGLVRAVARREPVGDYAIAAVAEPDASGREAPGGLATIELWRGPRFTAHVLETPDAADAAALARRFERAAAAWLAAPGTAPSGGRLAVVVIERARATDAP